MKPYLFDFKIKDLEDNESYIIRIEAESEEHFYAWGLDGQIVDFHSLPEESKEEIRKRINEHFFMLEAIGGWSR